MQKVISSYYDAEARTNFRKLYHQWCMSKPKHAYYVKNRKKANNNLVFDEYDHYILGNLKTGKTLIYDSAGYYLDQVIDDLVVVELNPIVSKWYPSAIISDINDPLVSLHKSADNFIINNTIKLRWKTFDEYTVIWQNLAKFLKPDANIFFSFRDIFIFHNRLKYNFSDLLNDWLIIMESYGFELINLNHELISIDNSMTEYQNLPEISDMNNGNIKIHWKYKFE